MAKTRRKQTERSIKRITAALIIAINIIALSFVINYLFDFYDLSLLLSHFKPTTSVSYTVKPTQGKKTPMSSNIYPLHSRIFATLFWIGEKATIDNSFTSNDASEWDDFWPQHYGGVDSPSARNGYYPNSFIPKENPFYIALPYDDLSDTGRKQTSEQIPWYLPTDSPDQSVLKNKWVKISYGDQTCYAQWEDVGPFETDDFGYVFGKAKPKQEAGIDVSPAVRTCLNMADNDYVDWQFVESIHVPQGPWAKIITGSPTNYSLDKSNN